MFSNRYSDNKMYSVAVSGTLRMVFHNGTAISAIWKHLRALHRVTTGIGGETMAGIARYTSDSGQSQPFSGQICDQAFTNRD
jgi:hypothetical protein